jgi:hypothetical protein
MKKFFGITNEELHLKINMFSNILYTCTRGRETCRMEHIIHLEPWWGY